MNWPPIMQSLFERVEHEARMRRPAGPPANNPPGIGVDHEGDIDEAAPGRNIGEVREPKPVWRRRMELPVDAVERTWRRCLEPSS